MNSISGNNANSKTSQHLAKEATNISSNVASTMAVSTLNNQQNVKSNQASGQVVPHSFVSMSHLAEQSKTKMAQSIAEKMQKCPKTLTHNILEFPYDSEEESQQMLEIISESIANIYSSFLTSEYHQNRNKQLWFNSSKPDKFPSCSEVQSFQKALKNIIIKKLNEIKEDFTRIELSTDYSPEGDLYTVLMSCGISNTYYDCFLGGFFPIKTHTKIYKRTKTKKIEIWMGH